MQGMELKGKTLGLIGLGGIGREMARLAKGIGLDDDCLQPLAGRRTRPCRWWPSTSCSRDRTS